jgi:iron complex outermembrane receptor protein
MLYNKQDSLNLRYLGQFDWGSLEARAYQENVDHFMDFGPDKRYWYGGSTVAGVVTGSGGSMAINGTPCSPVGTATCAAGMPMYTEGKTTGLSMKADVALNPQDLLRVGAELQQYRNNDWWPTSGGGMMPGTFWNIQDGKRDRSALFAELETRQSAQWMTLVGARVEQVKMDAGNVQGYNMAATAMGAQARDANAFNAQNHASTDTNLDLTALAKYTANANVEVEFGFAHKVRSPNVYERFPWSTWQMAALMNNFVGDGNGYVGNLKLTPEKANTLSATLDWHAVDSSWGFKATPFYTQVDDYIDAVQWNATTNAPATTLVTNAFSVLKYMNQSARLYGVNLSGHMPLAKSAWGDFGFKGLLNYTQGSNEDTGDKLFNIMPLNAKLAVTQTMGGWANSAELVLVSAKDDVNAMRNEIKTPGYSLVNLRGSYSWKTVRLDLGVENLFDKLYFLPTGGAYTGQGTTMTNPALPNYPQWGIAVPGMGRSIYVGVNVKF